MPKLYSNYIGNTYVQTVLAAAQQAGQSVELVVLTPEQIADKAFQAKKGANGFPLLELESGEILSESTAICQYFARAGNTYGATPFETAKVDEWIGYAQTEIVRAAIPVIKAVFGHAQCDFGKAVNNLKAKAKVVNTYLKDRQFLVGDKMTVADVVVAASFFNAFQTVLDGGFRKGMANLTAWFTRVTAEPCFVNNMGSIKMAEKALKAFDPNAKVAAAPKKATKAADDDDMDLFGDDNEDDGAAAKAIADAAKKAKKPKKVVIAQSLVLFEVKPLDDTTNLDDLAVKILSLTGDGIYWKSEYKKEPVAFGIFKLVIGVTVEDEKVSVDDLQEKIEAFDDMVQSVEILAFNKI